MEKLKIKYYTMDKNDINYYSQKEMAKRAKNRSEDYEDMTPEEQWAEDKRLGILDWNGED